MRFCTEWKSVYVDYSDSRQKAQIDRLGAKTFTAETPRKTERKEKGFLGALCVSAVNLILHANHPNPRD
jgi:hypothetical protein